MHTLGSTFVPPGIHAGGLRYHACAAGVARDGPGIGRSHYRAAVGCLCRRDSVCPREGIIPAPEANHAVAVAISEALRAKKKASSGRSSLASAARHFDMQSYIAYQAGKLENYEYPAEEIAMALAGLPTVG